MDKPNIPNLSDEKQKQASEVAKQISEPSQKKPRITLPEENKSSTEDAPKLTKEFSKPVDDVLKPTQVAQKLTEAPRLPAETPPLVLPKPPLDVPKSPLDVPKSPLDLPKTPLSVPKPLQMDVPKPSPPPLAVQEPPLKVPKPPQDLLTKQQDSPKSSQDAPTPPIDVLKSKEENLKSLEDAKLATEKVKPLDASVEDYLPHEQPQGILKQLNEIETVKSPPKLDDFRYLRLWNEDRNKLRPEDDVIITREQVDHHKIKVKISDKKIEETQPKGNQPKNLDKSTEVDESLGQDLEEEEDEEEDEKKGDGASWRKKMEEEEMERELDDDEKKAAYTGWFNDDIRRVDLVMVLSEYDILPSVQKFKADFLANILKTGLQLEFERGVMKQHKNLIFVKVHAPDHVLLEYGVPFGAKKYFKVKHLQFVKATSSLLDRMFRFKHEREWIKLVRKNYIAPLNYSNNERSYIVYQLLRHMSFGERVNHFGVTRLVDQKIVLAVYALHDGPYFFLKNQNYRILNARQILFYNWVGIQNVFKFQPLNLVHEYFGPKVGFYFAFYEFYNKALVVLAVAGVLTALLQVLDGKNKFEGVKRDACGEYKSKDVCPRCRDFDTCPFTKMDDYCFRITVMNYWDNSYLILYSFIVSCWAIFFIIFWRRHEKFWIWMWELCHPPQRATVRTEYRVNYKNPNRSAKTGILKNYDGCFVKSLRGAVARFFLNICGLAIIGATIGLVLLKYFIIRKFGKNIKNIFKKYTDYFILAVFMFVSLFALMLLELVCKIVSRIVTNFENHRTIEAYESSLIIKLFGFGAGCTFSVLIFFAWLKGTFYTYPHNYWSPKLNISLANKTQSIPADFLGRFFLLNCNPVSCLDEVIILFVVIILVKVVILRIWPCFACIRTDYNQGRDIIENVPSWEREYRLKPVTESTMLNRFHTLVLQFALMTWFVPAFPLAPALALLVNIWHIRHEARLMLVGSRRPVLFRSVGIGTWNGVLSFICFATAFFIAVTIVRQTRTILTYIYLKYIGHRDLRELLNYTLVEFDTKLYENVTKAKEAFEEYEGTKPEMCVFGGLYRIKNETQSLEMPFPFIWNNLTHEVGNFMAKREKFTKNLFEVLFIGVFQITVLTAAVLMKYYIPMISHDIKEVVQMEANLKRVRQQTGS